MAPASAGGERTLELVRRQRLAATHTERGGGGLVALTGARKRGAAIAFLERAAAKVRPGQARIRLHGERTVQQKWRISKCSHSE